MQQGHPCLAARVAARAARAASQSRAIPTVLHRHQHPLLRTRWRRQRRAISRRPIVAPRIDIGRDVRVRVFVCERRSSVSVWVCGCVGVCGCAGGTVCGSGVDRASRVCNIRVRISDHSSPRCCAISSISQVRSDLRYDIAATALAKSQKSQVATFLRFLRYRCDFAHPHSL